VLPDSSTNEAIRMPVPRRPSRRVQRRRHEGAKTATANSTIMRPCHRLHTDRWPALMRSVVEEAAGDLARIGMEVELKTPAPQSPTVTSSRLDSAASPQQSWSTDRWPTNGRKPTATNAAARSRVQRTDGHSSQGMRGGGNSKAAEAGTAPEVFVD
jgi:hypothetical protein